MVVGFFIFKTKTKVKMIIKLKKFGGSLALRIPYQIVKELSLKKEQLIRIQRLGTWEFKIKIFPDPQQLISQLSDAEVEKILETLKKNEILYGIKNWKKRIFNQSISKST
jgi:antitoxin component of MazEF toxin-antitoxin module